MYGKYQPNCKHFGIHNTSCSLRNFQCQDTWAARQRLLGSRKENIYVDIKRGRTVVKSKWWIGSCFLHQPSLTNRNWDFVHFFRIKFKNFFRWSSVHMENCKNQTKYLISEYYTTIHYWPEKEDVKLPLSQKELSCFSCYLGMAQRNHLYNYFHNLLQLPQQFILLALLKEKIAAALKYLYIFWQKFIGGGLLQKNGSNAAKEMKVSYWITNSDFPCLSFFEWYVSPQGLIKKRWQTLYPLFLILKLFLYHVKPLSVRAKQ